MLKLKRHSILILMVMLVLFLLPMSSAADDDAGDVLGVTDSDSIDTLSVDEIDSVESSYQDDVLSASYDYETTVTPSTVNYTKGDSAEVIIKTDVISDPYYDYDSTLSGYDFYAYIGGENSNPVKINIPMGWSYKYMKFNLAQISNYLSEGENKVYFHHSLEENIFKGGYLYTTKFNPLTINVAAESTYVTTPSPAGVYFYNVGDSKEVTVTVDYDDKFNNALSQYNMFVYINGEEIANRVAINGVKANTKFFTFDIASVSNKFVVGVNNLTFHPDLGDLPFSGPYVFNTLKVSVQKPAEPTYDYVSTPSPTSADYTIGESLIISVNATYLSEDEDYWKGFDLSGDVMYVYVNGTGVRIESVDSKSKSFKVDLKDINYNFVAGKTYSLIFHPANGLLSYVNVNLSNCKFNPLTITVKKGVDLTTTYEVNITNPASGNINYVKGNESVKISVKTNYNYTTMKALDNSKMYAFINGATNGIIVKNSVTGDDVRGSAAMFSFYLAQLDEYLTKDVNTIVFHPDESLYGDANISGANYQTLTVKLVEDDNSGCETTSNIKYNSTPTVDGSNNVEYMINEHKYVLVTIDCDLLNQFESYDKLLAWVGETSYQINMMANEGTVTVDLKDIINANYFEEGSTYTIYFHPDIDALNAIGIKNGEYNFNPLNVEIIGTYTPEPTIVYNSTPKVEGKSSIEYTLGENTTVTVKVDYNNVAYLDGFDGKNMYIFINNANGVKINNVKANATSFTVNLADYITEEGRYNISFHPDASTLSWIFNGVDGAVYKFNNLTVTAVNKTTPTPEMWYVSGPSVSNVTYVKGESCEVTFNLDYGDLDLDDVYIGVYLDGSDLAESILYDVDHYAKSVTIDLKDYDSIFEANKSYSIVVRHSSDMFDANLGDLVPDDCQFISLNVTVEAVEVVPEMWYVSGPSVSNVTYVKGESCEVTFNLDYGDLDLDDVYIVVYIDGSDLAESILYDVDHYAKSVTIDLKDYDSILEANTSYSIVVRHSNDMFDANFGLDDCQFNALNVSVEAGEVVPEMWYVSSPSVSNLTYVKGESCEVTFNLDYPDGLDLYYIDIGVYIDGSDAVSLILDADSYDKVVTFDLKELDDVFEAGKSYSIIVRHSNDMFDANFGDLDSDDCQFNPLNVTVKVVDEPTPNYYYETFVSPNVTSYTRGESLNVTVTAVYDENTLDIDYSNMCLYINGNESAIKVDGVSSGVKSFIFDLANISDKLIDGKNTIVFHCPTDLLEDATYNSGIYKFNQLTVNVAKIEKLNTTMATEGNAYREGSAQIDVEFDDFVTGSVTLFINNEEVGFKEIEDYYYTFFYIEDLEKGNYSYKVVFTSDEFNSLEDNGTFNVYCGFMDFSVVESEVTAGENFTVRITLPDDARGTVTVTIGNNAYPINVTGGLMIVSIPAVEEGSYTIYCNYSGDGKYNERLSYASIKVIPKEPIIEVNTTYTTIPEPVSIDYTLGESSSVDVGVEFDSSYSEEFGGVPLYVLINNNETVEIPGIKANATSFSFDLKSVSDYLTVGENVIAFIVKDDVGVENVKYKFNNVSVNVITGPVDSNLTYVSTPSPSKVDYTFNESSLITVTITYSDLFAEISPNDIMFVYINGEGLRNRVKIAGVAGNAVSFEFDLKAISDRLVDGQNNLTFHPHIKVLEAIQPGTYTFNPLIVIASPGEPVKENISYTTNPTPSEIDYALGESSSIDVSVEFDSSYSEEFGGVPLYVLINNNETVEIPGIKANMTSFSFDLKSVSDYLSLGENTIEFIVKDDVGIENVVYTFNNLTVNAVSAPVDSNLTYVSTPSPSKVDYTFNESSLITVTITYSDLFAETLPKDVIMFVYINGEGLRNRVKIAGVAGNDVSFEFDLKTISDKLVEGQNNLTFHPHQGVLEAIQAGPYAFNKLVVIASPAEIVKENISYTTTPTPSEIDYTLGESSSIDISVEFDSSYSEEFGGVPLYVLINNNETIEIKSIKANATSFSFDLKSVSDYLNLGKNTIAFIVKDDVGVENVIYQFDNVSVNAVSAPVDSNLTYVSTPSPSKVIYTLNESSLITVTITYSDLFEERMPEEASMFVYINGEEMTNRVKIPGVVGNATSFEFDLKTISDKLVEGQNNLTFHPHPGALEGIQVGPYTFNTLIVLVNASAEPVDPEPINPVNPAYNGVIYVSLNGSEDNEGSIDNPVNTIAKAIELASGENNTEHKIVILEGTYTEHDLNISAPLDISTEGNVVIDAQQLGRIFYVTAKANITGITFKNGKDSEGAAILWNADDGSLTNSKFISNSGRDSVVKVGKYSFSTKKSTGQNMVIDNCSFDANTNVIYGSCMAVDIEEGTCGVKIINSKFTNHKGEFGSEHGVLYIKGDDNLVDGCLFENNTMGMVAAIQLDGENNKITNSKFINNKVINGLDTRSGAIEVQGPNEITNNIFINNGGENCNQGGAIDIVYATSGGNIVISNNEFINNSAIRGAAIYVDGGAEEGMKFDSLTIDNNTFEGNAATYGSGIYTANSNTEIDVTNNRFKDNVALNGSNIFVEFTKVNLDGNVMEDGGIKVYHGEINTKLTLNIKVPSQAFVGEPVNVTATLTDDMGNLFSGFSVNITANNNLINETDFVNGVATVKFTPEKTGEYLIDAAVNGLSATVNTAIVNVVSNAKIEIPEIKGTVGENINVPVKVNVNGKPVENGVVNVTVDGKTFEVPIANGIANVSLTLLNEPGKYNITVSYGDVTQTKEFTVSSVPEKSASVISITLVEGNNITGVLKGISGNPIANAILNYVINGKTATVTTDNNGAFKVEAINNVTITISFAGDKNTLPCNISVTLKEVNPVYPSALVIDKVVAHFDIIGVVALKGYAVDTKAGEKGMSYAAKLLDANGNSISDVKVQLVVNDKIYNRTTDKDGSFKPFKLNRKKAGMYTIVFYYPGDDKYTSAFASVCVELEKKPIKIKASKKSFKATAKTKKYTVTLSTIVGSSQDGKAHLSPKTVKLKVNGKTYSGKTNSKGKVIFKLKLTKKAKYIAKITVKGDTTYKGATKKVKITVK